MRVPLEWLKEFVAIKLNPQQLAERLTMAGLEIGAVEQTESGPVFDIEITPNRPDWLSIIGIAREVSAITGQRLKLPPALGSRLKASGKNSTAPSLQPRTQLKIRIEDSRACPRYIGRLITGITIKPSPDWMQRRLIACGARPINNVVDITNYVLFEWGQPLHAFDAGRLAEKTICVRRAVLGEPITALDGVTRKLTNDILVIADAKQPVAIAGIMGGELSGVKNQTRNIVLESALFDPIVIRRAGRKLGLTSESAYRFERGVDPEGVSVASQRAAQLILELAGGTEEAVKDVGAPAKRRAAITVEPVKAQQWLGLPVNSALLRTTFARLGCRVASSGTAAPVSVTPPSHRRDLNREVDFYEEIARVIGYDRIHASIPRVSLTNPSAAMQSSYAASHQLRQDCASLGLTEIITWSLLAEQDVARCGYMPKETVRLANPLSQDHVVLRPSLLPGMLQVVRRNLTQGALGVNAFEVGNITSAGLPADKAEQLVMGIILTGVWLRDWKNSDAANFFRLKGLLQAMTGGSIKQNFSFVSKLLSWAQPEESTVIELAGQAIGQAALVSRAITKALDIEQEVWFAQVKAAPFFVQETAAKKVNAPGLFPPVKRDLSVLVNRGVTYEALRRHILDVAGAWAVRVELIDRYTGKQVPEGKYSATFSIEYRDAARTLTAAEVDAVHNRVAESLAGQLGAIRR